ncbi:MAG TPA: carboxypeptidase-like regulatory domain-containing protein [Gemmatimonadaceae bacterium]|nr:carboxypeptidase-like regulatory domain-containing protein [Gemmatimonadaceae bacterium]
MTARALALVVLVLGAPMLGAQALRVRATEQSTGRPLAGAIVDVLDASGAVVVQGVLSPDGRRQLPLAAAGPYRVRLRRIGYAPVVGPEVLVVGTATVDVALRAPDRRVVLRSIDVRASNGRAVGELATSDRGCARDAFADLSFAALWEEIRKALTTTVLSREDSGMSLEARAFRRVLDASHGVTDERVGLPRTTDAARPYVALSADYLSRNGYVQARPDGIEFYAPDEQVLLSDQFITDHCFDVTRGSDATEGLFGVRFTPLERRRGNDIHGTLWVDSASAELRYLDFWHEYRGLPRQMLGEDRTGGQVVFERRPGGAWIVSAWRLRMPQVRTDKTGSVRSFASQALTGSFEEVGGVVKPLDGDTVPPPAILIAYRELLAPARITGTVYDSLANRPLAGAQVWLVPVESPDAVALGLAPAGGRLAVSPVLDTADAEGRFALANLPAGTYRLAFEHPSLDTIGVMPPRYDIRLRPGATVVGDLAVPSLNTLAAGCTLPPGRPPAAHDGIVMGYVSSAADQRPLANALVRLTWSELARSTVSAHMAQLFSVETRTDSTGFYRLCGLPDSTMAIVQAAGPNSSTGEIPASTGPLHVVQINLRLAEVDSGQTTPAPGTIVGTVTDSLGRPQKDAQVTLDGSAVEARTDYAGRFRLAGVMPGTQMIEVKRVGLDLARRAVDVVPGETSTIGLTLAHAQLLDAMVVTAERTKRNAAVADAVRRHRNGVGTLLLEEQLRGRVTMQALIEGLPGVRTEMGHMGTDNQWMAYMRFGAGECIARVYVDGTEQDYDYLQAMHPEEVAALEVFVRAAVAPLFTSGHSIFGRQDNCGSIVLWTKR